MKKQVAIVTFPSTNNYSPSYNKQYSFLTTEKNLESGVSVIVDTVNGLSVATFVKYDELGFGNTGSKTPTKWIIQKVDLTAHNARVKAEAEMQKVKNMMIKKRKELEEVAIYKILAEKDPEMAKLVEQMEKLQEVL